MKRLLLIACAVFIGWYCLLATISFFASDEAKITWKLEAMEAGYNEGVVRRVVGPLSENWRHDDHFYTKRDVQRGLAAEFFQGRDPKTKKLLRRVRLDWESLTIEVQGDQAQISIEGVFERRVGETWEPKWAARFLGELLDGSQGWEFQSTQHEDLSGTQLSR